MPVPVRSRRERPAKPALSRAWIVAETIRIMRTEGLEKATTRRVAQALDTGPASLYVYVANTAELHAAVLDELLGSLELRANGDWRVRLRALLHDYAAVLFTYPGLARSASALRPAGPRAVIFYDRVLGLLLDGGIKPARAAWGVDLVVQYVTANAAEHSAPGPGDIDAPAGDEARWNTLWLALHDVDPGTAPHIAAHVDAVLGGTPAQRVDWAIEVLLAGVAATPTPLDDDRPLLTPPHPDYRILT